MKKIIGIGCAFLFIGGILALHLLKPEIFWPTYAYSDGFSIKHPDSWHLMDRKTSVYSKDYD